MHIGIHLENYYYKNILDALKYTRKIKANALQIFLGNKTLTTLREKINTSEKEILQIKAYIEKYNIKLYVHSILTLNFCSDPTSPRFRWGIDNLIYDMNLCEKMGGVGCILHLGTYKTKKFDFNERTGKHNFINSMLEVLNKTNNCKILIETMPSRKNKLGGTIEKLAELYNSIPNNNKERIKICVDTQHIFVSGYDLNKLKDSQKYFEKFNKLIGFENLELIHLNDSLKELGSLINRHAPIGKGFIFSDSKGKESLEYIVNLSSKNNISMILETNFENFASEVKYIKSLLNKNLIKSGGKIKEDRTNKDKKDYIKKDYIKKDIKELCIKIFKKILDYYVNFDINKDKKNKDSIIKFKIPSYKKAIKALEKLDKPIYSSNDVKNLEGIGKSFKEKIDEIALTKTLNAYENIIKNKKFNKSLQLKKDLELIWGIGPQKAKNLVNQKNIKSISNLVLRQNNDNVKLTEQQKIGLKYYKDLQKKIARNKITEFTKILIKLFPEFIIYNAGSYRMGKKECGDIDLIVTTRINQSLAKKLFYEKLTENKIILETLLDGSEKGIYIVKHKSEIYQMDVAFIPEQQLPWYLLYFGSSVDFSKKIRLIASKKGYKLNEKGLYDKINGKRINFNPKEEKEIFKFLEIEYVLPENR
jgi:apurinic endonuclease APN1